MAESNNILIGNKGVVSDSNTLRIGTEGAGTGQQDKCFIAGVSSQSISGDLVTVDSSGQLGKSSDAYIKTLESVSPDVNGNIGLASSDNSVTITTNTNSIDLKASGGGGGGGIQTINSTSPDGSGDFSASAISDSGITVGSSANGITLDIAGHHGANNSTYFGVGALNSGGNNSTAVGYNALYSGGTYSTAVGDYTLHNGGNYSTAIGHNALNDVGFCSTAIGHNALEFGGDYCIAIGYNVRGVVAEHHVTRIGATSGTEAIANCYIGGIYNATVSGSQVYVTSDGLLGKSTSSIRYKENVKDLKHSNAINSLRPVTFNYKKDVLEDNHSTEYGLIAEEVDKIYPDFVIKNDKGECDTVKYQFLPIIMLKEVQEQRKEIDSLKKDIEELKRLIK